ncbi:MAG: hypothetical protein D3924_17375 [Candidatus Electrothrix sp. AR4]|nr:hypothetical protein [Candidatus Electrothrix sp. AR4]
MMNNNCKNRRMQLTGYLAQFTENHLFYSGVLEELSIKGVRVQICRENLYSTPANIPCWFQSSLIRRTAEYNIVISETPTAVAYKFAVCPNWRKRYYKLKVRPRWRRRDGDLMTIDFELVELSAEWKNFVQQMIPENEALMKSYPDGVTGSDGCNNPDELGVNQIFHAADVNANSHTYL